MNDAAQQVKAIRIGGKPGGEIVIARFGPASSDIKRLSAKLWSAVSVLRGPRVSRAERQEQIDTQQNFGHF
jgi:hypothetical protein